MLKNLISLTHQRQRVKRHTTPHRGGTTPHRSDFLLYNDLIHITDKIKNKYGVELCYEKGDRKTEEQ